MDSIKCCIAKDLMPLYIDDVLSEDSAQLLRDHMEGCKSCREEYHALMQDVTLLSTPDIQKENSRILRKFKRAWNFKKFAIAAISSALTLVVVLFAFLLAREYLAEDSELFQPRTRAYAGTVGSTYLGELSDGEEWTRLYFVKDDLFSNVTLWQEPYLEFDNIFYEKKVVNHSYSSTAAEMRILDTEGNIVIEPFVIEPGTAVSLEALARNTPYIVEYRADGDFYMFTFQ